MDTFRRHWPEYAIEAACLGLFMVSAAGFATLLQHPLSPLAGWTAGWPAVPGLARVPMGVAMGLMVVVLTYSPLGRRSGAHMNPAITLTFLWLGKVAWRDAVGYVVAQFAGGLAGLSAAVWLLRGLPADPSVNYVATIPGPSGALPAFGAEAAISFAMMTTVLHFSKGKRTAPFTGVAAGLLVALFIVVEAPVSGMSMNPARTLSSNLLASAASTLWIYFTAPLAGMLAAAARFARRHGRAGARCAKLHHPLDVRCIFCGHVPLPVSSPVTEKLRTT